MHNNLRFLLLFIATLALLPSVVQAVPSCTSNYVGNALGSGGCVGSITYSSSTTLVGEVNVSVDILINSGVTLTSNGMILIAGNMINNGGTILTGHNVAGGTTDAAPGTSFANSYGGSGGGGAANLGGGTFAGNGITPSKPALTNGLIQTWYNGGAYQAFQTYLQGAGGGASGHSTTLTNGCSSIDCGGDGGNTLALGGNPLGGGNLNQVYCAGGNAGYGLYLQAKQLIPGIIKAYGLDGCNGGGAMGSGGGGGGTLIFAYNTIYTAGTYNTLGGFGGTGANNGGGNGGAGSSNTFQWTILPLAPSIANSVILSVSPNPVTYPQTSMTTATCTPNTDTCAVQDILGNTLISGTGNSVYTIPIRPVGSYNYWANDLTNGANSLPISYVVNANVVLLSCTLQGEPLPAITWAGTAQVLNASNRLECAVKSYNNQVTNGNMFWNGASVANGNFLNYNSLWNNQNNPVVVNTLATANYTANSINLAVNAIPFLVISNSLPSAIVYETQLLTFTHDINFTKAASNVILTLVSNGLNLQTNTVNIGATDQQIQLQFMPTLETINNIQDIFNVIATLHFASGNYVAYDPLATGTLNTLLTNILFNYIPKATPVWANVIFGQNETINVITTDLQGLGLAIYAGSLQVGTINNIAELQRNVYNVYGNLTSFPGNYGLSVPSIINSITINANAIVQFSYNGISIYRNQSFSFVSTNITLGTCSFNGITANALGFSFYTVPSLAIYSGNVFILGSFISIKGTFASNTILGTLAGLQTSGTTNTFSTCGSPGWANVAPYNSFASSGYFTYNAGNYPTVGYYLVNQPMLIGTQTAVKLYLANQTNPILYSIAVENTSTGAYIRSLVQILQFLPNSNTSVLVNEIQTPTGGTAQAYLQFGTKYRFGVYTLSGQLLTFTGYQQIQTCASQPCLMIIYLNNPNVTTLGTSIGNLAYNCIRTDTNQTSTPPFTYNTNIACTFSSTNGASYNVTLSVGKGLLTAPTCSKNVKGASGSISCSVGSTNNTRYSWTFAVNVQSQTITLLQGQFGLQGALYGVLGAFIAIVLALCGGFLFIFKNPVLGIVMLDVGFVAAAVIGLISVPIQIVGALQALVVLIVWIISRD